MLNEEKRSFSRKFFLLVLFFFQKRKERPSGEDKPGGRLLFCGFCAVGGRGFSARGGDLHGGRLFNAGGFGFLVLVV